MTLEELALVSEMRLVFHEAHGDMPYTLRFVEEVANSTNRSIKGECDFNSSPPAISIRTGLDETDLIEILCHELAHLVCGLESEHNETWENERRDLSIRFWTSRISGSNG